MPAPSPGPSAGFGFPDLREAQQQARAPGGLPASPPSCSARSPYPVPARRLPSPAPDTFPRELPGPGAATPARSSPAGPAVQAAHPGAPTAPVLWQHRSPGGWRTQVRLDFGDFFGNRDWLSHSGAAAGPASPCQEPRARERGQARGGCEEQSAGSPRASRARPTCLPPGGQPPAGRSPAPLLHHWEGPAPPLRADNRGGGGLQPVSVPVSSLHLQGLLGDHLQREAALHHGARAGGESYGERRG